MSNQSRQLHTIKIETFANERNAVLAGKRICQDDAFQVRSGDGNIRNSRYGFCIDYVFAFNGSTQQCMRKLREIFPNHCLIDCDHKNEIYIEFVLDSVA